MMFRISASQRYSNAKGMKVKHLVQLVVVAVLFTWVLYQVNISHKAKVASWHEEKIEDLNDDLLLTNDLGNADPHVHVDETGSEFAHDELVDGRSVRKSRKEFRPLETREIELIEDEGDVVHDDVDDSGEGVGDESANSEDQVRQIQETDIEVEGGDNREGMVMEEHDSLRQQVVVTRDDIGDGDDEEEDGTTAKELDVGEKTGNFGFGTAADALRNNEKGSESSRGVKTETELPEHEDAGVEFLEMKKNEDDQKISEVVTRDTSGFTGTDKETSEDRSDDRTEGMSVGEDTSDDTEAEGKQTTEDISEDSEDERKLATDDTSEDSEAKLKQATDDTSDDSEAERKLVTEDTLEDSEAERKLVAGDTSEDNEAEREPTSDQERAKLEVETGGISDFSQTEKGATEDGFDERIAGMAVAEDTSEDRQTDKRETEESFRELETDKSVTEESSDNSEEVKRGTDESFHELETDKSVAEDTSDNSEEADKDDGEILITSQHRNGLLRTEFPETISPEPLAGAEGNSRQLEQVETLDHSGPSPAIGKAFSPEKSTEEAGPTPLGSAPSTSFLESAYSPAPGTEVCDEGMRVSPDGMVMQESGADNTPSTDLSVKGMKQPHPDGDGLQETPWQEDVIASEAQELRSQGESDIVAE